MNLIHGETYIDTYGNKVLVKCVHPGLYFCYKGDNGILYSEEGTPLPQHPSVGCLVAHKSIKD